MKSENEAASVVWLFATPWTVACQALPSVGFSRQEYCSVLPFSSPGDLPDSGKLRTRYLQQVSSVSLHASPNLYPLLIGQFLHFLQDFLGKRVSDWLCGNHHPCGGECFAPGYCVGYLPNYGWRLHHFSSCMFTGVSAQRLDEHYLLESGNKAVL